MKVLTLPNLFTMTRIILIPVFVTALIYKRYNYALALFVFAGITDALDGLLARVTNQKTQLGAFLDPLADKFLLVTSFVLFSVYGWIPKWVTITVISRDLIVTLGWLLLYLIYRITNVRPSIIGKSANVAQLLVIAYVLLSINIYDIPAARIWMFFVVALLTISSGLQYIYRGLRQAK